MPRVAGVDVPDNKPIRTSLCYIYGLGLANAGEVLKEAKIDGQVRANKLTEDQLAQIASIIDNNYVVEGTLRRQIAQNIGRLRDIRCYRGERHRRGLPCHGQRTRTNARTRKGRKKTVAGKKGVKSRPKLILFRNFATVGEICLHDYSFSCRRLRRDLSPQGASSSLYIDD